MASQSRDLPEGIQVPVGRIAASRGRWQTVLQTQDKAVIYRLHATNSLIVEVDGAARTIRVEAGASLDALATRKIRVKAATGADSQVALGWYVMVS
jgi:hypothetical protein